MRMLHRFGAPGTCRPKQPGYEGRCWSDEIAALGKALRWEAPGEGGERDGVYPIYLCLNCRPLPEYQSSEDSMSFRVFGYRRNSDDPYPRMRVLHRFGAPGTCGPKQPGYEGRCWSDEITALGKALRWEAPGEGGERDGVYPIYLCLSCRPLPEYQSRGGK